MARAKSSVLSPADKKAVVNDLKAKLKAVKLEIKAHTGNLKGLQREFASSSKIVDKALIGANKIASKLEADLAAITLAA